MLPRLRDWLRQERLWDGFSRLGSLVLSWRGRRPKPSGRVKPRRYQPELERLESRELLAAVQFSTVMPISEMVNSATITVALTGGMGGTVTVQYATSNGTATAGVDYTAASGTLTFTAGVTARTFTVPITNDSADENDETVSLTLSNPTNATLGTPSIATLTITDDDVSAAFTVSSQNKTESLGTMTATVTLSGPPNQNVTVPFTYSGTATYGAGNDYTLMPASSVTFTMGTTLQTRKSKSRQSPAWWNLSR